MVVDAIKLALESMDKRYCIVSQIDYSNVNIARIAERKFLERPLAYEFYHQLRKLLDNGQIDLGGHIVQAEVDKRYQRCFAAGKIPDFLIHLPSSMRNLATVEFKLASNPTRIRNDITNLFEFKQNTDLLYDYGIEVIIGSQGLSGWQK